MAAILVVIGAAVVAVAIGTGTLRLRISGDSQPAAEQSAQRRCEDNVLERLITPSSARLSDIQTVSSSLDTEGRDLFSLTLEEPLKGVDVARITVFDVTGIVHSLNEFGSPMQDHFSCRAYFVDGSLAHTLVLFDHPH
ncbi:hypothetical protein [Mycobacterium sp. shizuoka-1]|uniref:hypothetical protein n=1 Tax=Mycobacterium sp. shizuoka-1 TaxID=2039281 RepID=UPI001E4789A1|nr:hypothetical protein [Mycobacterium sp. shizuoka-1]